VAVERWGGTVRLEAVLGDVTDQQVDAVVNAANSTLYGGGGVDGAIHRRGGPEILAACREVRRTRWQAGLPPGEAVATVAGRLPARWVIHTVGPVFSTSEDRSAVLASAFRRSLEVAEELGAASVAFPAVSTGVYGWPMDDAARIAVRTVRSCDARVELVRFVLFSPAALDAFTAALASP
jgi:O-acetyl-ADP-ribose deacetylase (regulator of RNase III)